MASGHHLVREEFEVSNI